MTRPRDFSERPPLVETVRYLRTSSGVPIGVPLTITNQAAEARVFLVSALGVDTTWVPTPTQSVVVAPGDSIRAELTLRPADGTLAARYPLVIAVQALDPATGVPRAVSTIDDIDLVVDAPGQISVALDPPDSRAIYSRKFFVVLQNSGLQPETVHLDARAPYSTAVDVTRHPVVVPPQSMVRVPGRLTVSRPRLFRRNIRHAYSVTARTSGAPKHAEGSLTAKSLIGPTGAKVVALLVVVAIWVALALIFVPKLADKIRKPSNNAGGAASTQTVTPPPPSGKKGGGGSGGGAGPNGSGSGGSGGGSGGSGSGGSGSGGSGGGSGGASGGGAAAGGTPTAIQLNGTVTGNAPSGVKVSLSPAAFGSTDSQAGSGASTQSAEESAVQASDQGPIGKLTPQGVMPDAISNPRHLPTSDSSVTTGTDGAWSFRNVKVIGFYTLQFSKPGYQTQRFIVDPTSTTATQPMQVALVPGTGALHGVVHNAAGGLVGGATITITDGTNTLTTSSISKGRGVGTWSVNGLSTPSSYLVSASADGLGVASRLVPLAASGTSAVSLTMSSGVATVSGFVHSVVGAHDGGLGAVQISATDGTDTRSATTVTTGGQRGRFVLPDLPLGTWVVTATVDGYQIQSRSIKVVAGTSALSVNMLMVPSTVTVPGVVRGRDGKLLSGAGLVLTNGTNTYKQTSVKRGIFGFSNVVPGTYTLTAEYFGYQPTSLTVAGVAGKTPKFVHIRLPVQHTSYNSVIAGFVSNAASSSGSLGCVLPPVSPLGCRVNFSLFDTNTGAVLDTTLKTGGADTSNPGTAVSKNGPTLFLLSRTPTNAEGSDGLPPGHYHLTISSPGYLPAIIDIDVKLNTTTTAPQIDMVKANSIAGRISAIGSINGDGLAPPITPGANCVVAVPHGYDTGVFDPTKFGCSDATIPTGGYGPELLTNLEKNCTAVGTPEPEYSLIDNDGKYSVAGLCDGTYNVYLVIGNTAYDPGAVALTTQAVTNGQSLDYSPTLPRRPLIDILVRQLDAATGLIAPITNTMVTVTCDTATTTTPDETVLTPTTDANGVAELWGVPAGQVTCSVSALGGDDASTGTFTAVDDQTYSETVTKVGSLPAEFGQVVSTYGSSLDNAVNDAVVNVTGTVSYVGATPVLNSTPVPVHTNKFGCYALTATGTLAPTDSVPAACGTPSDFTGQDVAQMQLRSTHVSVTVGGTVPTAAITNPTNVVLQSADDTTSNPLNQLFAKALPVSTDGITVTSVPSGLNLTNAVVQVSNYSSNAIGAGTITAMVNPSGQLSWADTNQAHGALATQGTYTVDVTADGFSPLHGTLSCGQLNASDTTLSCSLSPLTIDALSELHGIVTGPSLTPPHANTQLNGAVVYAIPCTTSTCDASVPSTTSSNCPALPDGAFQTTTNASGVFDFTSSSGRFLPRDTYELVVCSPTMITQYILGIDARVGGDHTISATATTLRLLGGVSGTIVGSNDSSTGLSGVAVALNRCTPACTTPVATTVTDSSGNFTFTDPRGRYFLSLGNYQLSFTEDGYTLNPIAFTVGTGDNINANLLDLNNNPVNAIVLTAKGALGGLVTIANDASNRPVAGAALALYACTPACSTTALATTTTNGTGNYQFAGAGTTSRYFLDSGTYKITATVPGYAPYSNSSVTVISGNNNGDFGMVKLGTMRGTITDNLTGNPGVSGATVQLDKCTDESVDCASGVLTAVGDSYQAVTDAAGQYSFVSLGNANLFLPGDWRMTVTQAGHRQIVQTVTLTSNDNTGNQVMTAKGAIGGTITNDDATPAPLNNATVDLYGCSGTAPLTLADCGGSKLATTTTAADGTYQLTGPSGKFFLDNGTYAVTATAAGYASRSALVTVSSLPTAVYVPAPGDVSLSHLAALQGIINDNTTGNPVVPGATVTVVPCLDPTATPCVPDTVAAHAKTIVTDSSGQFSFTQFGSQYVFTPGKWQVSITAPGHVDSTPRTVNLGNGVNQISAASTNPDLQLPLLVAYGSVTGIVLGTGNQQLSGASVVAHKCPDTFVIGTDDPSTCTSNGGLASAPTVRTNLGGAYTFSGVTTPWALPPGIWAFTATAFGYQPGTTVAEVASGVNDTGFDIDEAVRTITQTIRVAIDSGSTKYTTHAIVTLARTDDPSNQPVVTAPSSGSVLFSAAGLYSGSYLVDIKSDGSTLGGRIQESTFTLFVPLVSATTTSLGPTDFAPAIARTSLTGVVNGATGDSSSAPVTTSVPIALFPAGDHSAVATNLADEPLITSTGSGGAFTLTQIPTGTYDIVVNDVSHLTADQQSANPVNPQYGSSTVSAVTIVGNSPPQNLGSVTLARVTGTVTVTVNYDSSEDLSGGTGTLSAAGWSSRTADTTSGGTVSDGSGVFTFNNVPWGCWTFTLPFSVSSVHTGTVSNGSSTCPISMAAPTSSTPPSATSTYTFNEHKLVITPTVTANSPADAASTPSFNLTLTNSVPHQVFSQTITSASTPISLYLPSDTYSLVMTRASGVSADLWPPDTNGSWSQTIHLNTQSQTGIKVKAVEAALAYLTVPNYSVGTTKADSAQPLTLTLTCKSSQGVPAGCDTTPLTATDSGSGASFGTSAARTLAPGNWDLRIVGDADGPGGSTPHIDITKHLTLTSGSNSVTWP